MHQLLSLDTLFLIVQFQSLSEEERLRLIIQKQEIEMLPVIDYDGGVHKVFKVVDNKYVLKKTSTKPTLRQ